MQVPSTSCTRSTWPSKRTSSPTLERGPGDRGRAPDGIEVLALEPRVQGLVDRLDRDSPVYGVGHLSKLSGKQQQ